MFFPQELLVVVFVNESGSSILNFIKALSDLIDRAEQFELILDFDQVITVVGGIVRVLGSINTTRHHNSQRNEISNNLVNDVTDTIFTGVRLDSWFELDLSIFKVDFNVKDWGKTIMSIVMNRKLIFQVLH
jgi:hypothetical protein